MLLTPDVIAILAGGRSRRMGRDKAGLPIRGISLLEHTARIAGAALPVAVVGRSQPVEWATPGIEFLPDDLGEATGPLNGLRTILTRHDTVVALACDMPRLTTEAIRWLIEKSALTGASGLAIVADGRIEPLFSVYRRSCLAVLDSRLERGERSLKGLIAEASFALVEAPGWVAACLVNVNTPAEWEALSPA